MLQNPILRGFNADPSICKKNDDYYLAVSSFEWYPAMPIYHSKDLKNWELVSHGLDNDRVLELTRVESAKGIWAPDLTYCEAEDKFYLTYSMMHAMNSVFFDVDNFFVTADNIEGPWSDPVYLHSAGFDASTFHDDDGRKWIVSLEWESREGYERPGAICLCEFDTETGKVIGYPKRVWTGGTDRGCIEGPHIYKRNGWYYIMCAEGGTGYGHCVTIGRSKNIWGPYEKDPCNPIVTSCPTEFYERHIIDYLKSHHYNKDSVIQKSGHASFVETDLGEVYLVHLTSRPMLPELRCVRGRETGMQKMMWTEDGWLRMASGGNVALEYFEESKLPEVPVRKIPEKEYFTGELEKNWYAPRISCQEFAKVEDGELVLRGNQSLCSHHKVSLLAKKLDSLRCVIETKVKFTPEVYQHSAGLAMYYDNMSYLLFRKYYSETLQSEALGVLHLENGERKEWIEDRIPYTQEDVTLRFELDGRYMHLSYSADGENFTPFGRRVDVTIFSDEYSNYGEFTGAFVGLACVDGMLHTKEAKFSYFEKKVFEY